VLLAFGGDGDGRARADELFGHHGVELGENGGVLGENTAVGGYGGKKWREGEKVEGNLPSVTDRTVPRPFLLHLVVVGAPRRPGFSLRSPNVILAQSDEN
jgi:hypothetical protein